MNGVGYIKRGRIVQPRRGRKEDAFMACSIAFMYGDADTEDGVGYPSRYVSKHTSGCRVAAIRTIAWAGLAAGFTGGF